MGLILMLCHREYIRVEGSRWGSRFQVEVFCGVVVGLRTFGPLPRSLHAASATIFRVLCARAQRVWSLRLRGLGYTASLHTMDLQTFGIRESAEEGAGVHVMGVLFQFQSPESGVKLAFQG